MKIKLLGYEIDFIFKKKTRRDFWHTVTTDNYFFSELQLLYQFQVYNSDYIFKHL